MYKKLLDFFFLLQRELFPEFENQILFYFSKFSNSYRILSKEAGLKPEVMYLKVR